MADTSRSKLLDVYAHAGQTLVTVYLPSPSAVEDAEHRLDIRKKNVLAAVDDAEVSPAVVDHLGGALEDLNHGDGTARILVVGEDGILLSAEMVRPVQKTVVHVGPCPHLLPILAATQADIEHLAVLVDRAGADVMLRAGVGDPLDSYSVDGSGERLHRSHPGGWSQKRFQQTVENNWESNASEVVDQITGEYPDVGLILCGGDVRALGFFVDGLPARYQNHQLEGSRHSDHDAFLDEADTVLRSRAAAEIVELLDEWQSAKASNLGGSGLEVLDQLTQGRVDRLLVVDDARDSNRVSSLFDFSANIHAPAQSDGEGVVEAPVSDAAVALAVATGSSVTVVPSHPEIQDGLAAILRF